MYDLIIIGGGAAGSMAASHCGNLKTLIIEGSDKAMKKLEISGAGRCNLTHSGHISEFFCRYGNGKERFVKRALSCFDNHMLVDYFKSLGVDTISLENGKIFPKADTATVLSHALLKKIKSLNVEIKYNTKALSVDVTSDYFRVHSLKGEVFKSKYLLISGGGASFYKTGSDGSCFKIAKQMGHSISSPKPSLTPIYLGQEDKRFVDLAGTVIEDSKIRVISGEKINSKSDIILEGQLLFTHRGLSGPVILDGSRYINAGDLLEINFSASNLSCVELEKKLVELGNSSGSQMLSGFIRKNAKTQRIGDFIFEYSTGGKDCRISELPKSLRKTICKNICSFEFKVHSLGGYEIAMATCGGVSLKEISPKTMESRIHKNLYFAGEVIDIDGDTGGYNIQWAFSSAVLAINSIISNYDKK